MADSARMQQLKKLAGAMPVANQQVANGLQQAQATQFQSAISQAGPAAGTATAQTAGAQQAAAMAAPVVQAQEANQKQVGQVANVAQSQNAVESTQRVGAKESAVSGKSLEYAAKLAALNNKVKNDLLDQQLKFAKDERGRVMLNDRQLADVAILTAKNAEDLANYKQGVEQMNSRKLQAMETAYRQLEVAMKSGYTQDGQRLDFNTKSQIKDMMADAEKSMQDEKNRIANNTAMWGAAGTIVGSVVGGIYGGAGGAKAGGEAGGAGGGYAGSQG